MKALKRAWEHITQRRKSIATPAVAELDEKRAVAEEELVRQREGLKREKRYRRVVQAELDRMILTATKDVLLGKKAGEPER